MQGLELIDHELKLSSKPECLIACKSSHLLLRNKPGSRGIWLIFINGLGLPQISWQPCLTILQRNLQERNVRESLPNIHATTYDRDGQGLSKRRNGDLPPPHDLIDAAADLDQIIYDLQQGDLAIIPGYEPDIILISHSVGVPLTRLFIDRHTRWRTRVKGFIFVDSNVANTDMVTILPDPYDQDFDASALPDDTTTEALKWTRANYARLFAPTVLNAENLDRSTLPSLLPYADRPVLFSPSSCSNPTQQPLLTVIAHDPEAFARESLKISTEGLTRRYIEPAWHRYNLGLLKLAGRQDMDVDEDDIVIAKDAGHFVQRDNPECIADEIYRMIERCTARTLAGAGPPN